MEEICRILIYNRLHMEDYSTLGVSCIECPEAAKDNCIDYSIYCIITQIFKLKEGHFRTFYMFNNSQFNF